MGGRVGGRDRGRGEGKKNLRRHCRRTVSLSASGVEHNEQFVS